MMQSITKKTIFSAMGLMLAAFFYMPFTAEALSVNVHQPASGFWTAQGVAADLTGLQLAQNKTGPAEESKKEEDNDFKNEDDEEKDERNRGEEEVVSIGQDRVIQENETINGDAVVVGGNLTVFGRVRGDAVCVGGDLVLGPKATVRGDAVNVGGKAQIDPAAYVRGKKVNVSGFPLGFLKNFKGFKHRDHFNLEETFLGRVLHLVSGVVFLLFMLFMALLMTVFMPRQLGRIEEHLTGDFPRSALVGMAAPILLPLAFIVTCIGILFLPFLFLALLVTCLMGYIAFSRALGRKLLGERSAMLQIFVGLVLVQSPSLLGDLINLPGVAFSTAAMIFRVIGAIIFIGVSLAGLGAGLYSRWGKRTLAQSQAKRKPNGSNGSAEAVTSTES
ncbi:MAG: hypothetical protein EHM45_00950 [Desulfobacteraceae bacterium]|nr:MAG: hypothetical protein EHM45_00950 [Desulfobacteraceae bacterium]